MSGNKWVRGWFVVAMLALLLLPTTASALETMEQLTSKGRANIGFNTSLSYTSATNETVDGERARNARTHNLLNHAQHNYIRTT